jgi:hypothetical protein
VVRTLAAAARQAKVLESCQMGKLKEAHANNDNIGYPKLFTGGAVGCQESPAGPAVNNFAAARAAATGSG